MGEHQYRFIFRMRLPTELGKGSKEEEVPIGQGGNNSCSASASCTQLSRAAGNQEILQLLKGSVLNNRVDYENECGTNTTP